MVKASINSFSTGEIAPDLLGRYDLNFFSSAAEFMENYIPHRQGACEFRSGTKFVGATKSFKYAKFIVFRHTDSIRYLLEFTDKHLRFYKNGVLVKDDGVSITGIASGGSATFTLSAHGFSVGESVFISGVSGIDYRELVVSSVTTDTFSVQDLFGLDIAFSGTYTSGGKISKVYSLTTSIEESELDTFQVAQESDVMYIVHTAFSPVKLERTNDTSWSIGTFTRTADPFSGSDSNPVSVAFFERRLAYGGTVSKPNTVWVSRSPSSDGSSRYDDFTTGAADDFAIIAPVLTAGGGSESLNWIATTRDFLAIGSAGGISGIGGDRNEAITPTNVLVRPLDPYGSSNIDPITTGFAIFYAQKGGRVIRGFEYVALADDYKSTDYSFFSHQLLSAGVKRLVFKRGVTDLLLAVTETGQLRASVLTTREDVSGWFRIKIGGQAKVLDVTVESRDSGVDVVWVLLERTIKGVTVRYLEYLTEGVVFPEALEYYDLEDVEEAFNIYESNVYELMKDCVYVDSYYGYDGEQDSVLTFSEIQTDANNVTTVKITSSKSMFSSSDLLRRIQKTAKDYVKGGSLEIYEFVSATVVKAKVLEFFSNYDSIPSGAWRMTTTTVKGLWHLEGEKVSVVGDGRIVPSKVVEGGSITLDSPSGVVKVGFAYKGIYKSVDILPATKTTPVARSKKVSDFDIKVSDSVGGLYGTAIDRMQEVYPSMGGQKTDRPPLVFSGILSNAYKDKSEEIKNVLIIQDKAYPFMFNNIVVEVEVGH